MIATSLAIIVTAFGIETSPMGRGFGAADGQRGWKRGDSEPQPASCHSHGLSIHSDSCPIDC